MNIQELTVFHFGHFGQIQNLSSFNEKGMFSLHTCQRSIFVSFQLSWPANFTPHPLQMEKYQGAKAYGFLLEILCGLQSKIVAESEVAQQFKQAYTAYLQQKERCSNVIRLLEKLFKDAKVVRSQYLNKIGQKSYAYLAKKILAQNLSTQNTPVLILGNGELAQHQLFHLEKHYPLAVCGRNKQKILDLKSRFNFEYLPWENRHQWRKYHKVINTIGASEILFDTDAFYSWDQDHQSSKAFIDLGFPSVIDTELGPTDGVYRLVDIFKLADEIEEKKRQHLSHAQALIGSLTQKRVNSWMVSSPKISGEQHFA